jgi:hypothetical protein
VLGRDRQDDGRIRAIAECQRGERSKAVATALRACDCNKRSFVAQLTLAILHVMVALSDTAELQLGAVPNPFSAALVKGTEGAIENLDLALTIFDQQMGQVDDRLVRDLEIWKLATLLIHPTRTREARTFADDMLARTPVDPVAVAWCHSCGFRLKQGRIRKLLEDDIRVGRGTPTHVVVLAIVASNRKKGNIGAAIIARHRPQFPDADGFLLEWQKKLEGVSEEDHFSRALNTAQRGYNSDLIEYVKNKPCSADQILVAGGVLANHGAWHQLDLLREKVLAVGTPHAVDMAARAAVEVGVPRDAIEILDKNLELFRGQLPASRLYSPQSRIMSDQRPDNAQQFQRRT